jgi:uncharacterized membrane protein YkgB
MSNRLQFIGMHVIRYGLVLVLLWIGGMKFTAYEAEGIRPLVVNSALMGWVYNLMSVTAFSSLLGVVEIVIGVLIALRPCKTLRRRREHRHSGRFTTDGWCCGPGGQAV